MLLWLDWELCASELRVVYSRVLSSIALGSHQPITSDVASCAPVSGCPNGAVGTADVGDIVQQWHALCWGRQPALQS